MSGKVLIYPHKHEKITLYLHISECFIQIWSIFLFVFLRSLYCHFEKNPIFLRKISFREKSYFFQKKTRFSHDNHCMFTVPASGKVLIGCCTGKNVEKFCFSPKFFVFLRNFVFLQNTLFLFLLHSVCLFFLHSVCLFLLHSVCLFLLHSVCSKFEKFEVGKVRSWKRSKSAV